MRSQRLSALSSMTLGRLFGHLGPQLSLLESGGVGRDGSLRASGSACLKEEFPEVSVSFVAKQLQSVSVRLVHLFPYSPI